MESSIPVLLLDGGFSNELSKRCSYDVDKEPLWTAKALVTDTKAVVETHLEYLKAGADIIETASYQATVKGLQEILGLTKTECEERIANSVKLAKTAISEYKTLPEFTKNASHPELPLVAGSVGPYAVYRHDGSEYNGSYINEVSKDELLAVHSDRLEILAKSDVNLLALETMPALVEVELLLEYLQKLNPTIKVWVSFTLQEDDPSKTAYGDSVVEAFKKILTYSQVCGFGTNCINPKNVTPFLKLVGRVKQELKRDTRLIVYPNVGKTWISGQGWSDEKVPDLSEYAKEWLECGANVLGGCCQVGPEEIRKLRIIVDEWNSTQSQ